MSKYCPNCGTENTDASASCSYCGIQFVENGQAAPVVPNTQPSQPAKKMNTCALVGFIMSLANLLFCCGLLSLPALIVSIIGLGAKKKNQAGWGFALAGVIISAIYLLICVIYIVVIVLGIVAGYNSSVYY